MGNLCQKKWKRTLLYCFFLWLGVGVFAAQPVHSQVGNSNAKTVSLETVINYVKEKTSLNFLYNSDVIKDLPEVKVDFSESSWEEILKQALEPNGYTYQVKDNIVVISREEKRSIPQQIKKVRVHNIEGVVRDQDGETLVGATVGVFSGNGDAVYTVTDYNGRFNIQLQGDELEMVVSFIGFKDKRISIDHKQEKYNIILESEINDLDEVIVTGIFDRPKTSFTGAATIITKKQIRSNGNRNLLRTIANIDPSLDVQEQNSFGSDPNNTTLDIQIRGASSIADVSNLQLQSKGQLNTPLFILDGFEISVERVLDMNQNDVESVVILKDASATSIYGSRGANGVVVITSSHPPLGKLRVTYTAGLNMEIPDLSSYDLMNSKQKLELEKIAGLYTGEDIDEQIYLNELYNINNKAVQEGVNTNWLKIPTRIGAGQYHRLSIGGGDEQFRYAANISYNNITGAMKGSNRNNFNAGLNLQYLFKNIKFSNQLDLGFNKGTNSPYGSFSKYYDMNPYWRPYDENGDPVLSYQFFGQQTQYNPVYDAKLASFSKSDYNNIRNQTSLSINLSPNFKWDTNLGLSLLKGGSDYFSSPLSSINFQTGIDPLSRGSYTKSTRLEKSYQISSTLNYGKTFGNHSLFAGINGQVLESTSETMGISVKGFTNENLNDISNGISYVGDNPTINESTTRSVGLTGTLNYNYANKYFIEGSVRLDGASSFGSEKRFAPFYSYGLAWDAGQEKVVKENLYFINQLKFRYSHGVTGSLNFSAYQALTTYSYDTDNQYTNITGLTVLAMGNPNLQWQNTVQDNFGVDISTFNNRLGFNFNYYEKTTENLIGQASLPYSNGYTELTQNFGTVKNVGYDAQLSINVIRNTESQFSWYVTAGAYHNKNILVELSDAIKKAMETYEGQNYSGGNIYMYREGESIDELYVLKSPGVDPLTGQVLYEDPETGDISYDIGNSLGSFRKIGVGSYLPKINGRLGSSLRYKGLMFDMAFTIRLGAKKLNNTLLDVENSWVKYNSDRRVLSTRWQKPGDITGFKDLGSEDNTIPNDRFVFTERTFALSNINLSYQFPQKWVEKLNVEQVSLTGSISDVFYLSNISMQRGTDYPYSIRPTLNLSVTF